MLPQKTFDDQGQNCRTRVGARIESAGYVHVGSETASSRRSIRSLSPQQLAKNASEVRTQVRRSAKVHRLPRISEVGTRTFARSLWNLHSPGLVVGSVASCRWRENSRY